MSISGLADRATQISEEDRTYLVALERWPSYNLPPLTDAKREWVHSRIDELQRARLERSDAHRERLTKTAAFLGREVAGHRVLLADAQRRLEAMALTLDPDTDTPVLLVPYADAITIIEAAFTSGYNAGRSTIRAVA